MLEPHASYIEELRKRIGGRRGPRRAPEPGKSTVEAVAKAADLTRTTLWRLLHEGGDQRATIEAAEAVRNALEKLQPDAPPLPPAAVAIIDSQDYAWLEAGRALRKRDPAAFDKLLAELAAVKGRRAKR